MNKYHDRLKFDLGQGIDTLIEYVTDEMNQIEWDNNISIS